MLKVRIIPIVLLKGYSVVKSIRFSEMRNLGNPIVIARIYNSRNVDELVLLDIDASKNGTKIDSFTVEDVASECFMPLTVGGGLKSLDDIAEMLAKGADKVALNASARSDEDFITRASQVFGAQCIVASIDVITLDGKYFVYSHENAKATAMNPIEWARRVEALGAGEILLNSVSNDGMMKGCDLELVRLICEAVTLPVIAVGGVSCPEDAVAVVARGASAVGAASIFHFTSHTPQCLRNACEANGYPVRKHFEIEYK
jgi:cyclase